MPRYTRKKSVVKMTRYQEEMEKLLYATFESDQAYGDLLITNGNTFDYVKLFKRDLVYPYDWTKKTYQEFQDSLVQHPMSRKTLFVYNDEHLLL